jgi:hypothetical protein
MLNPMATGDGEGGSDGREAESSGDRLHEVESELGSERVALEVRSKAACEGVACGGDDGDARGGGDRIGGGSGGGECGGGRRAILSLRSKAHPHLLN